MALNDVSMEVEEGEKRVIIGPNGAGKTTLFNLIGGQHTPSFGGITFFGMDITKKSVAKRASLGIARTFQITRLPLNLSVFDSIMLGIQATSSTKFHMWRPFMSYGDLVRRTENLLRERRLFDKSDILIRNLSYGVQREIEIALALAGDPKMLLLDEPAAGLSPAETEEFVALISGLKSLTCLIIEHDIDVALKLADRISVLHFGNLLVTGTPGEIRSNPKVNEIYFGETTS